MNLLVKKLWPPVIIVLAVITVISCEDPGRIGLIINADNGLLRTGYKEIILPSTVVQFDPRKTSGSSSQQAGSFSDAEFGDVDFRYYSQLSPSLVVEPAESSNYVKFTLSIGFTNMTGPVPQSGQVNYLAINQLDEPIDSTVNYLRTDTLRNKKQLGEWEFKPFVNDTLRTDSTYIVELDNTVGSDLFNRLKAGDPIFNDKTSFNEYFNGISLQAGTETTHVFALDPAKTFLTLHYTEQNTGGSIVEREYNLFISGNNFHHISVDYGSTALGGIMPNNAEFNPLDDYRYMQSGTMLAIKIDLAPFSQLTDTIESMIINKAEIFLDDVDYSSDYYKPPNDLLCYFTNDTNEWPVIDLFGRVDSTSIGEYFVALQEQSINVDPGFYGINQLTDYNADSLNYNINISNFCQNLYAGNYISVTEPFVEEHGLVYIFTETSVKFPTSSPSHEATTGFRVHKDNIKLRIYYSYPRNQQTE